MVWALCCKTFHLMHSSFSVLSTIILLQDWSWMYLFLGKGILLHQRISSMHPFWLVPLLFHTFLHGLFHVILFWQMSACGVTHILLQLLVRICLSSSLCQGITAAPFCFEDWHFGQCTHFANICLYAIAEIIVPKLGMLVHPKWHLTLGFSFLHIFSILHSGYSWSVPSLSYLAGKILSGMLKHLVVL